MSPRGFKGNDMGSKLTKAELQSQRDAMVRASLDDKRNGVRMGTLIVLGIIETTEESADFADRAETLQRSVLSEILANSL